MADKDPVFVVITISGNVWRNPVETGYFGLLRNIYVEMSSAGGNWDCPWTLLMNGKVVVPEKLKDIAWDYCRHNDESTWALQAKIRQKFHPVWLPTKETI